MTYTTKLTFYITILFSTVCNADNVKNNIPNCVFPDQPSETAPAWVCDEPVEGIEVSAVGMAQKSTAGSNYMESMAIIDARVQIAQAMQLHIQEMVKQYANTPSDTNSKEGSDTHVIKYITNETMVGTRVFKTSSSSNGTLYVLLGLDSTFATLTIDRLLTNKATENALKESMENDKALWQQFKAKEPNMQSE